MLRYALRRVGFGLLTLVLISFVVYGLSRAMPGDPSLIVASDPTIEAPSPQDLQEMRKAFGLDKHWTLGYLEWLGKVARGDLGTSIRQHAPVLQVILEALGPTLLLSATSLVLAYFLSVPLGLYSAYRSGKPDERFVSAVLYVLYSFPSYVAALFLLLIACEKLGWLPPFGMRNLDAESLPLPGRLWDLARHMALPVTCYAYGSLAYYTRFIRSNLMEALSQDYIRTARAKGLSEWAILWRHAFRNTLIPFVTLVGLSFPALVGGSVILEEIFAWPGMGRLFFHAVSTRDYPLIMGLTMMFSIFIILGTFLADLLYAVVDPRISYS